MHSSAVLMLSAVHKLNLVWSLIFKPFEPREWRERKEDGIISFTFPHCVSFSHALLMLSLVHRLNLVFSLFCFSNHLSRKSRWREGGKFFQQRPSHPPCPGQIFFSSIQTNTFCNSNKYFLQFEQILFAIKKILFAIQTNTFCNSNKDFLQFKQILFAIQKNTCCN